MYGSVIFAMYFSMNKHIYFKTHTVEYLMTCIFKKKIHLKVKKFTFRSSKLNLNSKCKRCISVYGLIQPQATPSSNITVTRCSSAVASTINSVWTQFV